MLHDLSFMNALLSTCYRKTGNKFSVCFNGSKGYISNIEIFCEGTQKERNNLIWVENLRCKNGQLKSKMISIFHSEEDGITIEIN